MRGEDGTGLAEGQALMVVLGVWFDELLIYLTVQGENKLIILKEPNLTKRTLKPYSEEKRGHWRWRV